MKFQCSTKEEFYSRYFLIPKQGDGLRPILDSRNHNRYIKTFKFRMLSSGYINPSLSIRDWYAACVLKDACFHVAEKPAHSKIPPVLCGIKSLHYHPLWSVHSNDSIHKMPLDICSSMLKGLNPITWNAQRRSEKNRFTRAQFC